ncbi:MAG: DEAD/DEAH box helicase family protein [Selenomonas sp.]|uniref:DEAD/DEAH box helicase n=1 Tax=Selenomonas sp. TaxID=2053611 RepID=UPI0025E11819|nr:DEAD/DEAH box helicase family protein [Selenomonas sp.]MCI6084796.1 DEAD/DEAH box helicase family protein [Selenomonas sp.]
MEPKQYQQAVLDDLAAYLAAVDAEDNLVRGWERYWAAKDIAVGADGVPSYHDAIPGVPHVTMKVPTGGGKTFLACASLKTIFSHLPQERPKAVVWLVPSDAIRAQTERALLDKRHPYRQRIERDFQGRSEVYTKEPLLAGAGFSPDTVRAQLSICVLSYASLRIDSRKKDIRKVFQENGQLYRFAESFAGDAALLPGAAETSLMQALRALRPVVVVDESHNAASELSREMLANLNPSFILDLTATPRTGSNILSYVDARELKREHMVKLPVIVYNRKRRDDVYADAVQLRARLEDAAKTNEAAGGRYIRPIVLFQAQPKTGEERETFDQVKKRLLGMGIPEEQIAIKTSQVDTLGTTNLLSRACAIRYIITVNALKEGWDCPFAYILASLANRTSRVDVEQILGRILRQPYAAEHGADVLNLSYVLASSEDFHATLASIVAGLNASGFSRKDYRVGNEEAAAHAPQETAEQLTLSQDADSVGTGAATTEQTGQTADGMEGHVGRMLAEAQSASNRYTQEFVQAEQDGRVGGELGTMMHQYHFQPQFAAEARALKLPQFCRKCAPDLFGGEYRLLAPENLSDGFSLAGQDAQVDFQLSTGDVYEIDLQREGEAVPKYRRASQSDRRWFEQHLASLPKAERRQEAVAHIIQTLNNVNRYADRDIRNYVARVVEDMSEEELRVMESASSAYGDRIKKKMESLEQSYRRTKFRKMLDTGAIVCRPWYELSPIITPSKATSDIAGSLYEAERDDMNRFERDVLDAIVSSSRVRWWHRIIERKGFFINGPIHHYPDFLVRMESGKILLVEAKGDYLDGSSSREKLDLGRRWQEKAGGDYRYFMVFDQNDTGLDGAYPLDAFTEVLREL